MNFNEIAGAAFDFLLMLKVLPLLPARLPARIDAVNNTRVGADPIHGNNLGVFEIRESGHVAFKGGRINPSLD